MAALADLDTTNWFTGYGKIVYDPVRETLRTKNDWWVVLDISETITDYYRWWANRHVNPLRYSKEDQIFWTWPHLRDKREDLLPPTWGAHMSIIRGEKPPKNKMHLWKKYDGKIVQFKYSNNLRYSGDKPVKFIDGRTAEVDPDKHGVYWFVDAVCDTGKRIRDEFGFPSHWSFHITVGRVRQEQNFVYVPPKKSILL